MKIGIAVDNLLGESRVCRRVFTFLNSYSVKIIPNIFDMRIFVKFLKINLFVFGIIGLLLEAVLFYLFFWKDSFEIGGQSQDFFSAATILFCICMVILFLWSILHGCFTWILKFTTCRFKSVIWLLEILVCTIGVLLPYFLVCEVTFFNDLDINWKKLSFLCVGGLLPLGTIFSIHSLMNFIKGNRFVQDREILSFKTIKRSQENAYWCPILIIMAYFLYAFSHIFVISFWLCF